MAKTIKASELYSVCLQVAKSAGDIARNTFESGELNTQMKGENDPVTQADLDAQMMIEATLEHHFPGICMRGEEEVPMTPDRALTNCNLDVVDEGIIPEDQRQLPFERITIWIDPLDGTNNYVTGDVIGVTALIGVCLDSKSIFGIIHHPFDEERPSYYGGPGVTLHKIIDVFTPGGAPAEILPPQEEPTVLSTKYHDNPVITNYIDRLPMKIVRVGGTGLKCTYVALGVHTAYIYPTPNTKKWDTAGPEAILNAVGGVIVDMKGNNYEYHENVDKINREGLICCKDQAIVTNAIEEYAKYKAEFETIA